MQRLQNHRRRFRIVSGEFATGIVIFEQPEELTARQTVYMLDSQRTVVPAFILCPEFILFARRVESLRFGAD